MKMNTFAELKEAHLEPCQTSKIKAVNPLMPGDNKKVTYLNKPAAKKCMFV